MANSRLRASTSSVLVLNSASTKGKGKKERKGAVIDGRHERRKVNTQRKLRSLMALRALGPIKGKLRGTQN